MRTVDIFLSELLQTCRTRIADGTALHISTNTLDELELLAAIDWSGAGYHAEKGSARILRHADCLGAVTRASGTPSVEPREIDASDIAWAWLRLSAVTEAAIDDFPGPMMGKGWRVFAREYCRRASERSELAAMAAEWVGTSDPRYDLFAKPHDGRKDGAAAAWIAIVTELHKLLARLDQDLVRHAPTEDVKARVIWLSMLLDRYTGEYEALRR